MIAFAGLLISYSQFAAENQKLKYERSKELSAQFSDEITNLAKFLELFPPLSNDTFEWARTGISHPEKVQRMTSDYTSSLQLLRVDTPPVRAQDILPENPNPFSTSSPAVPSFQEEMQFALTRRFDLIETSAFTRTEAMLIEVPRCIQNNDCDAVSLCLALSPLLFSWSRVESRVTVDANEWRSDDPHPAQAELVNYLNAVRDVCDAADF